MAIFQQLGERKVRYDPFDFAAILVRPRFGTNDDGVNETCRRQIAMGAYVVKDQRRCYVNQCSVGYQNIGGAPPWNCHAAPFEFLMWWIRSTRTKVTVVVPGVAV